MLTIHKYPLYSYPGFNAITTHKHGRILCVKDQSGTPHIWIEVDTNMPTEEWTFAVYNTGELIPKEPDSYYIGSVFITEYAFHVYEVLS